MLPISYQVARARQAELLAQAEHVLEDAGYLRLRKSFEGRRPRTWVSATRAGRAALAAEVAALRQLIARLDG